MNLNLSISYFMIFVFCTGNIYLNCSHESIFSFFLELFESGFMFRSMTNPELTLCMAWDENQNTFSSMKIQSCSCNVCEETSPQNSFDTFEKKKKSINRIYMGLFLDFILFHYSICLCLDQYHCLGCSV